MPSLLDQSTQDMVPYRRVARGTMESQHLRTQCASRTERHDAMVVMISGHASIETAGRDHEAGVRLISSRKPFSREVSLVNQKMP